MRTETDAGVAAAVSAAQLDRHALIAAVLGANRDLEAMRQGWRAALAEVAAAGALDDPRVSYELAPLSIGSADARFGQRIELSQKLPWPGKRALASEAAAADAEVMRGELHAARLEVAMLASQLYDAAYLNARALEVNDQHRALVEQMQHAAEARIASGRGSTQDALQAEVELGHLEHDRVMLETEHTTITARLNGLLHRDPAAALPAPPPELAVPSSPGPTPATSPALAQLAVEARPQRAAADARVHAGETRVRLAERAYYPDFEIMASYDSMWDVAQHRWMVGVAIDVPIQRARRDAEVDAARARVAQAQAVRDRTVDDIRVDVTRVGLELDQAIHVVQLYDARLVPAARAQVEAALAGFATGQNDFPAVINAERGLREVQLGGFRARAEVWGRRAALDRALGRMPGEGSR
ncbi:MAG TPA: TolC family protein [Kofleriaceae bacterium]|nr:TolC family protein [Kofleriaceae bacterium]